MQIILPASQLVEDFLTIYYQQFRTQIQTIFKMENNIYQI